MQQKFGRCPTVVVDGDSDAHLMFVPVHIEYILQELYKNAFRATAEHNKHKSRLPPVRLTVCANNSYITLRISDEGGGFPYTLTPKLWEYSYTSISPDDNEEGGFFSAITSDAPRIGVLAGLGFGLPMSRVYAEYFGGSLELVGLYGHGADVYLRLLRLDKHADRLFI